MSTRHNPEDGGCACSECEMVFHIVRYMLFWMPRSDRAIWPEPAPRLELPGRG